MVIETLKPNPPKENPFNHDYYHMGTYLGASLDDTSVCIMFAKHKDNAYVIVVDCVTGQRIKVSFERPALSEHY